MANKASKLVLNQSSIEYSFSVLERGRGSDTVWRPGAAIESCGRFGIPVASASERRRLRDGNTTFVLGCAERTGQSSGEPSSDGTSIPSVLEVGEGKCEVAEALRTRIMNGGLRQEPENIP